MDTRTGADVKIDGHAAGVALRLLVVDDHEMVRIALRYALAGLADSIEWLEAGTADEAHRLLSRDSVLDLAIVDLTMPGVHDPTGLEWIRSLRSRYPSLPLLVISANEDPTLVRALIQCGVAGFIPKSESPAVILQAVRLVLAGGTYAPLRLLSSTDRSVQPTIADIRPTVPGLTPRQREVLSQLAHGFPNKRIARELSLSESTVKVHLLAIYRVLAVRNRTEAVVAAQAYLDVESKR